MEGFVGTVLGPVDPESLGVALVHEHLFIDLRHTSLVPPPAELAWIETTPVEKLDPELLARHSCSVIDNLVLEDVDLAVAEAGRFAAAGGRTLVDVTPPDIGRDPLALRAVAERTGLNVVMGCGSYCEIASHPDLPDPGEDEIAATLAGEIEHGVAGTGIRPGIIGEMGVNGEEHGTRRRTGEITDRERRALRGAAIAARLTGAPMTIHMPSRAAAVPVVLDELDAVGAPMEQISLSHMDAIDDFELHVEALRRGAWINYDCFGMALENDWYSDPGDERRCDWLAELREAGHLERVMVSHDVWCKGQLHRYGGAGYDYILREIPVRLAERGFTDGDLGQLLVTSPATFLTFRAPGSES